jgi:hypothetical protein
VDYETLYRLQNIKIKLLEDFILEAARINDLYGWHAEPDDMEKLNSLSVLLTDISDRIKEISGSSSVGRA